MATSKQIAANRRNAQTSTGPTTAEGREIVSRNAITHGLTAARAVVLPDEQEEFDQFAAAMRQEGSPQGPLEHFHMDRIIHCAWRLKRMTRLETAVLLALQKEAPAPDDPAAIGQAYIRGNGALTNLSRHERQIERSLHQAQHELELAKYAHMTQVNPFYARNLKRFPAPEVVDRKEDGPFSRNAGQPCPTEPLRRIRSPVSTQPLAASPGATQFLQNKANFEEPQPNQ